MLVIGLVDDSGAVHSRVDFGVRPKHDVVRLAVLFQLFGVGARNKRLNQAVFRQLVKMTGRRVAQNQDIRLDAALAQLDRLVDAGNAKDLDAASRQRLGASQRPVAVGVRLDDTHDLRVAH